MAGKIEVKADGWDQLPEHLRGTPELLLFTLGRRGRIHTDLSYRKIAPWLGLTPDRLSGSRKDGLGVIARLHAAGVIHAEGFGGKQAIGRIEILWWDRLFAGRAFEDRGYPRDDNCRHADNHEEGARRVDRRDASRGSTRRSAQRAAGDLRIRDGCGARGPDPTEEELPPPHLHAPPNDVELFFDALPAEYRAAAAKQQPTVTRDLEASIRRRCNEGWPPEDLARRATEPYGDVVADGVVYLASGARIRAMQALLLKRTGEHLRDEEPPLRRAQRRANEIVRFIAAKVSTGEWPGWPQLDEIPHLVRTSMEIDVEPESVVRAAERYAVEEYRLQQLDRQQQIRAG